MRISPDVITAVQHAARRAAPLETCGVLLARGDTVVEAVETANRAPDSHRFEIDALQSAEIERAAQRDGLTLAGYFHTHPGGDVAASEADRSGIIWPELPPRYHLIVAASGAWALYRARAETWALVSCQS